MKSQAGGSGFDTVLKMLMIALISVLAFSVGVYLGSVMSDNERRLSALEPEFNEHGTEHAAEKNKDYDQSEEDTIAAEDVEALSDKYISAERGQSDKHGDKHGDSHDDDVVAETDGGKEHAKKETSARKPAAADKGAHGKDAHGKAAHGDDHGAPKATANAHGEKKATANAHGEKKATVADAHGEKKPAAGHGAPAKAGTSDNTVEKALAAAKHAETRNVASTNALKPIVKSQTSHDTEGELTKIPRGKSAKPDMSAAHEAARRVASNDTPTPANAKPVVKEDRVPSSLPKSVGTATGTQYTVQVASYPNVNEATKHANELVKKGFPAYPVEANVKGKAWYRVSVGSFKTIREATDYRSQLMKQAELTTAIVQKIER